MTTTYVFGCPECLGEEEAPCDCILGSLLDHRPGVPVVLDEEEVRALRVFSDAGLVPPVTTVRRLRAVS